MAQFTHNLVGLPAMSAPGTFAAADPTTGSVITVDPFGFTWSLAYTPLANAWVQLAAPQSTLAATSVLTTRGSGATARVFGLESSSLRAIELVGGVWSAVTTNNLPTPRIGPALCGLPNGDVLLFGGQDPVTQGFLSDTWVLNGPNWRLQTPTTSPGRRAYGSITSNAAGVLMFGGVDSTGALNDLWQFAGGNWAPVATTGGPPQPRFIAGFANRQDINTSVLIGGLDSSGNFVFDAWLLAGGVWSPLPYPSTGSVALSAALDPVHNEVIAGGGGPTLISGVSGFSNSNLGCFCNGTPPRFRVTGLGTPTVGSAFSINYVNFNPANLIFLAGDVVTVPGVQFPGLPVGCSLYLPATASVFGPVGPTPTSVSVPNDLTVIGAQLTFQAFQAAFPGFAGCSSNVLTVRVGR